MATYYNGWFDFDGYIAFDGNYPADFQVVEPDDLTSSNIFDTATAEPGEVGIYPETWQSSTFIEPHLHYVIYPAQLESSNSFGYLMVERGQTFLRQLERLPHFYNNNHDSNNAKLVSLVADEIDEVYTANFNSELWRVDLDESRGKTLDHIGTNLQQPRGMDMDIAYRQWLYTKLVAMLSRSQIGSHNQALELIVRDAYLSLFESWAETLRLNQKAPNGYYLDGSTKLDGLDWQTEVDEPAAVIIEMEHHPFFRMIRDRYRAVAGDEGLEPYLSDIIEAISRVRNMMSLVKAGGVGMFYTSHVPGLDMINPETDEFAETIKLNPAAITKIAFGDGGHYTTQTGSFEPGDQIAPTGSETEVYGEHTQLPLQGENMQVLGLNSIIATAFVERDEMNGETVSSIGLYDSADELIAIKNIHPFKKDENTRIVVTWRINGVFFNGVHLFNGEIYFEGAA